MPKIFIKTWGCTLNQSDGDIMKALLEKEGHELVFDEREADAIVLNTCTVKGATENKIVSALRKRRKEGKNVVVAGCLTVNLEKILRVNSNAVVVGAGATQFIGEAVRLALEGKPGKFIAVERKFHLPRNFSSPIARLPICEGCAGKCSFCQTRLARPLLISYPAKEVVRLAEEAVAKGAREIQLTGMDTGAYGMDIGTDLVSLLRELLKVNGAFRVRLGMINPGHVRRMENGLVEIFKERKMYKFLHMPVQTGSEKVCKEMKRQHSVADFENSVWKFREEIPGIMIATDIIAGYPTESEDDYGQTLAMLEQVRPDIANISGFTARAGTVAKGLRQLKTEVVKKRTRKIHELVKRIANENAQKFVGMRMRAVMTENGKNGQMKGRAENYRQVVVSGGSELLGKEIMIKIEKASHSSLCGKIMD